MNTRLPGQIIMTAIVLCLCSPGSAQDRPNVIFMLADNLGFGDVSAYNLGTRGRFETPNIDRLAAEGLQLTQFLVEPTCTASRCRR